MNDAVKKTLDLKGEKCPKPILASREALKSFLPGDVLKVVSTDPLSKSDFEVFARMKNITLLKVEEQDGAFIFYLQK
ncbi:MAG: sulfurtransferase TusA family protein [Gammaproteobacteria bacterium]